MPRKPRLAACCASSGFAAVGGGVDRLDLVGRGDERDRLARVAAVALQSRTPIPNEATLRIWLRALFGPSSVR